MARVVRACNPMEDRPSDQGRTPELPPGSGSFERQVRHRMLAARTVAVSFRAAMQSAERHLNVPAAERDEIMDGWRSWALETLEGYSTDLQRFAATQATSGDGVAEGLARCREELDRAFEMVRTMEGDG